MNIFTHQGFGDHIICNGLIRNLADRHKNITVLCLPQKKKILEFMYRDNDNINVLEVETEKQALDMTASLGETLKIIGHGSSGDKYQSFDKWFYAMADIEYEKRFKDFHVQRDLDEEQRLFEKLVGNEKEYAFLHDDPSRGFVIDRSRIRDDIKIIENNINDNFFNYRKIFENATELHLMQSGIYDFTNSIPLEKPKIFVHKYVRGYSKWYDTDSLNERVFLT